MAKAITTTLDRKLWLTVDQDELVENGDRRARFLWGVEGRVKRTDECERLGYKPLKKAKVKKAEPAEPKEAAPVENKEAEAPENKAKPKGKPKAKGGK